MQAALTIVVVRDQVRRALPLFRGMSLLAAGVLAMAAVGSISKSSKVMDVSFCGMLGGLKLRLDWKDSTDGCAGGGGAIMLRMIASISEEGCSSSVTSEPRSTVCSNMLFSSRRRTSC